MSRGRAQIIADGATFSLVWDVGERIQPGGVQVGLASVSAALNAVKPLAGALPGAVTRAIIIAQTTTSTGRVNLMREAAGTWTLQWMVDGNASGASQSGLSLPAALDAIKAKITALPGAFQYATVLVGSDG